MLLDFISTRLRDIRYDVDTSKENAVLKVSAAGVAKDNIEVDVNVDIITVKIEDTVRRFKISNDYIAEDVTASYENGLLTLTIPRKKTKTVKIN